MKACMIKNIRFALLISSAIAISGCATGDNFQDIARGMSRPQVIEIMGSPDGVDVRGNQEMLSYYNRLMSGWAWNRADYKILMTDDYVTAYAVENIVNTGPAMAEVIGAMGQGIQQSQQRQNYIQTPTYTTCNSYGNSVSCSTF